MVRTAEILYEMCRVRTWEQPCPSNTPKKWCLPQPEDPGRKSGRTDTASSISRRGPQTEVTPYLGHHHLAAFCRDPAHATLRRFPPPWSTAISTLGRRRASAGADLASSQQISAMAGAIGSGPLPRTHAGTYARPRRNATGTRATMRARFLPRPLPFSSASAARVAVAFFLGEEQPDRAVANASGATGRGNK